MEGVLTNICYRLTRKCNLKCSFCFACDNMSNSLMLDSIKQSIIVLKELGMESIRLGGGEPTLHPDLIEIIKFCVGQNLDVILFSNLFNIEKLFDDLVRLPISVTTSIHGNELEHNNITGTNSYKSTVANINKFVNKGMNVNIHFIVTKKNYYYLGNIVEDCTQWGVKKISFQTFIPRERGKYCKKKYELSLNEIKELSLNIAQYRKKYGELIKIKFDNLYEKYYYVFELDGNLYLQKSTEEEDILIRRII